MKELIYSAFRSCINLNFEKLTYDWFCGPVSHNIKYCSRVHEISFLTLVLFACLVRVSFRDKQIPELAGQYVVQFVLALDKTKHLWSKQVCTHTLLCVQLYIPMLTLGCVFVFLF